jgi:GH24 family phage-related lysozyme (muramidase)
MTKISKKGINLIKEFEGCQLKAYKDEVGVWTIGYGITNADKSITGTTVKKGLTITKTKAEEWLEAALNKKYVPLVAKYDSKYHWNQNELDALASFAYNIGSIDKLTADGTRTRAQIAKKMLEYNKAGGKIYAGLTRRRKAERALFLTACEASGYPGTFPALPPRWYYQIGDGYKTLTDYKTQIKRVQKLLNWAISSGLEEDGEYGAKTAAAVEALQEKYGLSVNGKFGKLSLGKCKKIKK